jgi:ubiquinol-cytochrome c reductase iron-sulfur subunit
LADTTHPITVPPEAKRIDPHEVGTGGVTRRDFLLIATGAFAAVGTAATIWPFIDQMNPDASALALGSLEVNTAGIQQGQSIIVKWRGKPVVIRYRTDKEMQEGQAVDVDSLRDPYARNANLASDAPATDANRTIPGKEQWMVMIQVCTHLGCIPLGQEGEFGGWFCPCHGSQYDTAGRIRKGPAPENMAIPPYAFTNDTTLRIG